MKSALILLNAPVSDAAAKMFAEPDRLDTEADADGEAVAFGETDGEADALGVADAVTVGVGVAVCVTAGVTVSVNVGVGVGVAVGVAPVATFLLLQAVATTARQARRARQYRSRTGGRIGNPSFLCPVETRAY
jgi:hypothetical protein